MSPRILAFSCHAVGRQEKRKAFGTGVVSGMPLKHGVPLPLHWSYQILWPPKRIRGGSGSHIHIFEHLAFFGPKKVYLPELRCAMDYHTNSYHYAYLQTAPGLNYAIPGMCSLRRNVAQRPMSSVVGQGSQYRFHQKHRIRLAPSREEREREGCSL